MATAFATEPACVQSVPTVEPKQSGTRSLLDVLQINAPRYVQIGQMYQDYIDGFRARITSPNAKPEQAEYDSLLALLRDLQEGCAITHMVVSARTLERTIEEFKRTVPNFKMSQERLTAWFSCFTAELETQMFLLVEPNRVAYLPDRSSGLALLQTLSGGFPDARFDAHQAGSCFAFGCFTASVYHLMRAAEHGLVSVAAALNVDPDKIAKGWDGCLMGIHAGINLISSTKPTTDWQSDVKKYSDLSTWFTTMKSGWRNPVSHIPRTYAESTAEGMFAATRTLFEHLNKYGFKQTVMPSDPLQLP